MRTCKADWARRRRRILDLAGQGLSAWQIAERLSISRKSVHWVLAQGSVEPNPLCSLPPGASLAQRLKALRSPVGFTQERLALEIGVSTTTVVTWETGKCQARKEMLQRLAQALQVTVKELTGEE
jgi:DNA-binding XRE family transcriptional regulator